MASPGLQALLAVETHASQDRSSETRPQGKRAHWKDVQRESLVGRSPDQIGAAPAGHRSRPEDGGQVHGPRQETTVSNWRTFLKNHVGDIAAIDFFTVPTVSFRVLFCFIVLRHERRRVVHFNVTAHPTAQWTAQQLVEAFPFDEAPCYLLRDRDSIYGQVFQQRIHSLGVEQVIVAARCPWQNPYARRIIASNRRECLDHVIVLNEAHLLRVLGGYFDYYHSSRPHLSLACNAPNEREIEPPARGRVVAEPQVGGLHHRYRRAA